MVVTVWFYVKTVDDPKIVGEVVCSFNFIQGEHPEDKFSYVLEKGKDVDEGDYWEIKSKYAERNVLVPVAMVYRVKDAVVVAEVDDDLTPNFIDPLLEKYGFDNLKWIVVPSKK
jgi:hypothetical protein